MKLKRITSLFLLLTLTFTLLFAVSCTSDSAEPTDNGKVRVITAKKTLAKGSIVSINDIDIIEVEKTDLPEGYIRRSADAVGRKILKIIKKGEILTSERLSSEVYEEEKESSDITLTEARALGYVIVTDYIKDMSKRDLSEEIQEIIDDNPNSTIYFPDGVYSLARTIKTSSRSSDSVALHLSSNAVLKAADNFGAAGWYLVQIGILDKDFGINTPGSNYYMYGGIIDCNGYANGVEISAGREFSLRNVTIKNAQCGLHIAYNQEYASNDSDTENLNIAGNGKEGSIGVLVDGFDNTLTNLRVSGFETGVRMTKPGNLMHNIRVVNIPSDNIDYDKTKGFWDTSGGNWYDACISDDYRTGFFVIGTSLSVYNSCTVTWSENRGRQYAFETDGVLNATITEPRAIFVAGNDNALLVAPTNGGNGIVKNPIFDTRLTNNDTYKRYLVGHVVYNK